MRSESSGSIHGSSAKTESEDVRPEEQVPADEGPADLRPLPSWRGGQPRVDISDRDALYRVMEEE